MDTIANMYRSLIKTNKWKYYDFPHQTSNYNEIFCKSFIVAYLGQGNKTEAPIFKYIESLDEYRIKHIISCFFLGIVVYEKNVTIQKNIDFFLEKLPSYREESNKDRFLYIWMLISIFHDFGYAVEEKMIEINNDEFDSLLEQMPNYPKGVPKLYDKHLLKNYNGYKCCRFCCYDHGIIGGIRLYSDLCKLREEKEQYDYDNKQYWKKDLENDFSIAAWAIACHNIFYLEESSKYVRCYERFGIEKLVYQGEARNINLIRHPIFYLLCLVDSIEPLKTRHDVSILNEVKIDISAEKIEINLEEMKCPCKKTMYSEKTISLKDWLTDVEESDDMLIIHLKTK